MRPAPPAKLLSLLPISNIWNHWQQQQQQQGDAAVAAAAPGGEPPLPPPSAVSSWLCSGPGLHALSDVLRPGSLLERLSTTSGRWEPVVVVHSSLAYTRQASALHALLQEGFATSAEDAAAAEPGVVTGESVQLPAWQQVDGNARIALVLALNAEDGKVRRVVEQEGLVRGYGRTEVSCSWAAVCMPGTQGSLWRHLMGSSKLCQGRLQHASLPLISLTSSCASSCFLRGRC